MRYKRSIFISITLIFIVVIISAVTFILSQGPCPKGSFSCDNGAKCVLQREICDKRADCSDGQDEDSIECGRYHGSFAYLAIMVPNHTQTQQPRNFSADLCVLELYPPKQCFCRHMTAIICNNSNLTAVPRISDRTTSLFIKNTSLVLANTSLDGLQLQKYLNFKNNHISDVPVAIFRHQRYLRYLYLDENRIHTIHDDTFIGLASLESLMLGDNRMSDFSLISLEPLQTLRVLNVSNNRLTLENQRFPHLRAIMEIYLEHNMVVKIDEHLFASLGNLQYLSLKYNHIEYIHPAAFWGLTGLKELRLANNRLAEMVPRVLQPMIQLDALYIGFNKLRIAENIFQYTNISLLNIDGIEFEQIDFRAIRQIHNLKAVVYKKFFYCSETPHIRKCKPNTDGVSSLNDLLTKPVLRYSAWLMATLSCFGNSMVLLGRFACHDENRAVSMVIRNLAVADILMGMYLLIIGIQDYRYRERYQEMALDWVGSWKCATTGVLAMTSSEVSLLILAFMSVERFLLIADPFGGHRRLTTQNIFIILLSIWLLGLSLAIVPIIHWRTTTFYYGTYSGTCFPMHLQEGFPIGWQYSAFVFLGINMFLLIVIATLYTGLLVSIWRTRKATPLAMFDFEFAIRFFFIVFTDVSCWAPIMATKIFVFFNYEVSTDVYAWLVVFILPLNSAVNPLLYTFTTPKYRNQVLLRGWNKFASRKEVKQADGSGTSNQVNFVSSR